MYRLSFEDRIRLREPYVTREPLIFIGRDPSCSLRLAENGVSDRHAAVERREDGYYVRDLDSANGVRVNGELVSDRRLMSGDEVQLGSVRIRFEIVHEPPSRRRPLDSWQFAAIAVVAAILLGQLAVLNWIFSERRSRHMRVDKGGTPLQSQPASPSSTNPAAPLTSSEPRPSLGNGGAGGVAVAPAQPALNRMIKILRVDRTENPEAVTLQIQVKAQVGERALDAAAVAMAIQFVFPSEVKTIWATIPTQWENFSAKAFAVRCPAQPSQLQGYVVRTYYRKQVQDAVSVPPGLLANLATPTP